jgi:hypothetical protein
MSVVQNRARQRVQAGEHRRAGGGEARDGFEHRISNGHEWALGEEEWQRACDPENDPEERDDQEAVPYPQFTLACTDRPPDNGSREEQDVHSRYR